MSWTKIRFITLIFVLAVLAIWLTSPSKQSSKKITAENQILQDYSWSTTQTTIWQISTEDKADTTVIQAEQFNYQNETQQSRFSKPQITLFNDTQKIKINSLKGSSNQDTEIVLAENVTLIQTSLPASKESQSTQEKPLNTQLKTEQLTYNVETQKISSENEVWIQTDNTQITGRGLQADVSSGDFEIKSDVKTVFTPK